jgi:hypothetical protein
MSGNKGPVTYQIGDIITGGGLITLTPLGASSLLDGEGNVLGQYAIGGSFQGVLPKGPFTVAGAAIKIWEH